ncbi:MAG: hypothetical protein ACMUEM_01315 [Flavobacteriales bacterium AspAUS03]
MPILYATTLVLLMEFIRIEFHEVLSLRFGKFQADLECIRHDAHRTDLFSFFSVKNRLEIYMHRLGLEIFYLPIGALSIVLIFFNLNRE